MGKLGLWGLTLGALFLCPLSGDAQPAESKPGLARQLLEGCLQTPTSGNTERLASAAGAKAFSDVRRRRELKTSTFNSPEPDTGEDQRTRVTVTDFQGWDLAGQSAGTLVYQEDRNDTDWVDRASQQPVKPMQTTLAKSCRIHAPVANARAILELYEQINEGPYGIRISADRRWIDFFMFDEDGFDIELSFALRAPLAGLTPDAEQREGHLILPDGGARYFDATTPGIPNVRLTRAALLAGLDQTATMDFMNETIKPVVQRLR